MIISDVLNFADVDYVLSELIRYLKPGGRVIAFHVPSPGHSDAFAERGAQNDGDLENLASKPGIIEERYADEAKDSVLYVFRKPNRSINAG